MEAAVCGKSVSIRRLSCGALQFSCAPAHSFLAAQRCAGQFSKRSTLRPAARHRISQVEKKTASAAEGSGRVCLNTATMEELLELPGVGEKTAERILAYRDTYGKFVTTQQLLDVEGIGEGLLEKLRPYVYVEEIE